MATTTISGHVSRALDFFERNDIYFGIGRPTPWPDEEYPPPATIETTQLDEAIGYKKVETVYLVVPDEAGTISYRDSSWRVVPANEAIAEGARWVYIDCHLRYDELPLVDYRQIGVFSRLTLADGVPEGKFNLLPSEVGDNGILEIVDNRKRTPRQIDMKEKLSIVIEF